MRATVNGITIAYSDRGQGLPVVWLHAFPFNRTMWEGQVAGLSDRFRVIAVDLRGHGESDAPLWRYTLDLFADDVVGLLDHLGIRQAVFAGLSMGGYTLFALHRCHPERIKGLIFCDTRAEADKPEQAAWRFNLAQQACKAGGAQPVADDMGPKLLAPATYRERPEIAARVRAISLSTPLSGVVGDLMAMAERPDSTPQLARIACPTLVIVGEDDALTTVADNKRIADGIAGARLEIIPQAGHMSNMDQPKAFNRVVAEFLAGLT